MREGLNHDYSSDPDSPNDDFCYVGHGLEALWMVMDEAVRRRDGALFDNVFSMYGRLRDCRIVIPRRFRDLIRFRCLTRAE